MRMIISLHAREEMEKSGITEEEVSLCLEHGEKVIKQIVKGEVRYGNEMSFKEKTIIIIYTEREEGKRVITVYPVRRKKWLK